MTIWKAQSVLIVKPGQVRRYLCPGKLYQLAPIQIEYLLICTVIIWSCHNHGINVIK